MNPITSVRPTPRVPLPRGPEHEVWIVDMTPPALVRKTWTPATAPYSYTPAGVWVRRTMPDKGWMLARRLLARLADYAGRMEGELHAEFRAEREAPPEDLAELIVATALIEDDTPFCVLNILPSGRARLFYRMECTAVSWHPDARRPRDVAQ